MTTSRGETRETLAGEDRFVSREMAAVLRAKTPAERLQIGFNMWSHAQRMLRATILQQQPMISSDDLNREVARRLANGSW